MIAEAPSVLVVGNYCHDTLIGRGGAHQALGGSVAYACAVLHALDVGFRAVAKVGPDFLYGGEVLAAPTVVPSARTTRFIDAYSGEERSQTLAARCAPIAPADLAGLGRARIAIAAGVAGEVLPETLLALRGLCDVLLADAQGLLRSFGPAGEVRDEPLSRTAFAGLIGRVDYLKASESEARFLDLAAVRRQTTVLLTLGARGCRVIGGEAELAVAAPPAEERDPTGAGDAFLAGFAAGLSRGLDAPRAARLGNYCGARAVEHLGVPRFREGELLPALGSSGAAP